MAFVDTKQKMKKTNLKSRLEQKEQARKAYNKFAKVPILPNYTYQLPKFKEDLGSDEEEEEGSGLSQLRSIRQKKRIVLEKESTHAMPATMVGGAEGPSNRVDDEFVTVEVKPLFGGEGPTTNQGSNFSDLPSAVEQELIRLRRETKGPAKTKSKIHMMKELEKIRKIKKYSRKGHGKKTTSGKRKNRKK
ncbi:hypothetical protein AGDE_00142 [Angomonas deanei]|uniref:Nucleolar protein 12 n=1 Tax=Angomonas deanei TaxID=59799 RepID=A0A7G2CDE4_9TRYP|nr:hypothetical protein AGDE_00142 [Angomonas deanei]CAD2216967.1 hypothetical protein, conserved [Angomonas deanei]|eukprot:EPY43779.1 hypothetical protein AGDE_00142 [Angomonas deanei]